MHLDWSAAAWRDLARIWDHNSSYSDARAARVEDRIIECVASLLDFPYQGRPVRGATTRDLSIPDIQYLIRYQPDEQGVSIVRVWSIAERRA